MVITSVGMDMPSMDMDRACVLVQFEQFVSASIVMGVHCPRELLLS